MKREEKNGLTETEKKWRLVLSFIGRFNGKKLPAKIRNQHLHLLQSTHGDTFRTKSYFQYRALCKKQSLFFIAVKTIFDMIHQNEL